MILILTGVNISFNMALLQEARRERQAIIDAQSTESQAMNISQEMRTEAERLLKAHGKVYSPTILLKRFANLLLLDPYGQLVGRNMINITLGIGVEETRVTLVSRNADPKKSPVIHLYVEGLDEHLELYNKEQERSASIVRNGKDAPGYYRGDGSNYHERLSDLFKYNEILEMIQKKIEPQSQTPQQ